MENWRGYLDRVPQLNERTNPYLDKCPDDPGALEPGNIFTIGCLMAYFAHLEPTVLQKLAGRWGGALAKITGAAAGIAVDVTGGGTTGGMATKIGTGAGVALGEAVFEKLLMTAVMAFANIPDDDYTGGNGSAASFFDIDDKISTFLRQLDTKNVMQPSGPEKEVFAQMQQTVHAAASAIPEDQWATTRLDAVIQTTTQNLLNRNLLQQDSIKIQTT